MKKKNTSKLLKDELGKFVNSLDEKHPSNDAFVFKQKLDEAIEAKVSKQNNFDNIKRFFGIGAPLFVTGFLIARFTLPMSVGVKGIDENSYVYDIPTTIIEIASKEKFNSIVNYSMDNGVNFEFTQLSQSKQMYFKGIMPNNDAELKDLLGLDEEFEGPVTLILE